MHPDQSSLRKNSKNWVSVCICIFSGQEATGSVLTGIVRSWCGLGVTRTGAYVTYSATTDLEGLLGRTFEAEIGRGRERHYNRTKVANGCEASGRLESWECDSGKPKAALRHRSGQM